MGNLSFCKLSYRTFKGLNSCESSDFLPLHAPFGRPLAREGGLTSLSQKAHAPHRMGRVKVHGLAPRGYWTLSRCGFDKPGGTNARLELGQFPAATGMAERSVKRHD